MKTVQEIQQMLDESVNQLLGQHRGRVDIVSVERQSASHEGATVNCVAAYVKMSGGCRGCAGAKYTLKMLVQQHIKSFDPTIDHIVDITDHADKKDAYYKE
jgi:Fe-S cluster biogenesis protein NfuA